MRAFATKHYTPVTFNSDFVIRNPLLVFFLFHTHKTFSFSMKVVLFGLDALNLERERERNQKQDK